MTLCSPQAPPLIPRSACLTHLAPLSLSDPLLHVGSLTRSRMRGPIHTYVLNFLIFFLFFYPMCTWSLYQPENLKGREKFVPPPQIKGIIDWVIYWVKTSSWKWQGTPQMPAEDASHSSLLVISLPDVILNSCLSSKDFKSQTTIMQRT